MERIITASWVDWREEANWTVILLFKNALHNIIKKYFINYQHFFKLKNVGVICPFSYEVIFDFYIITNVKFMI